MSTQERDGIPEWTPKIGIQCAILDLRENAIRLRDGSYSPQTIADDLEVIVNDLSKCFPVAQQEQPESWTRHPNPVHHIGPLSEEHLRDVVERTKAMQVALDAWVAQAQSGQTEVPCPLAFVEQTASVDAYVGAREDAAIWKKRALVAEELNRKFIAEVNGPMHLGEPAQQEQPAQEPVAWDGKLPDTLTKALASVYDYANHDAAGDLAYQVRQSFESICTTNATLKRMFSACQKRCEELEAPPTQPALSDEQIEEMYFGELDNRTLSFARAIEAHCRGGGKQPAREHITDGTECWCEPDTDFVDPDTGAKVIVHRREQ